ncbi:MAG: site-specific integrase [Candidatus Tenebribacter mawsonii]|nr:site-specific integrase [Candidatus Tenebribacter mawsonii]
MNEKLIKEIRTYNHHSKFKIKYRKQKHDYSLYLEIQRIDIRKTINLKGLTISGKISNLTHDKQIIQKASEEQSKYEFQYKLHGNESLKKEKLCDSNVIEFYEEVKNKKTGNTYNVWTNALKHFTKFNDGYLKFSKITLPLCESYREYLLTVVSPNTTSTYFSNFKAMLNIALKKNYISKNPALFVLNPGVNARREFLTEDEIIKISTDKLIDKDIKNAFLFSCFTGLRISDIRSLTWKNIKEENLEVLQKKTSDTLRMKISSSAQNILSDQRNGNKLFDLIFGLPGEDSINKHIKRWVHRNSIDKHITFHCARHTFATLCLTYDIDLYTVSKLLGHKDIKHTQIYAKIIDKKRDDAIDKLPDLNWESK